MRRAFKPPSKKRNNLCLAIPIWASARRSHQPAVPVTSCRFLAAERFTLVGPRRLTWSAFRTSEGSEDNPRGGRRDQRHLPEGLGGARSLGNFLIRGTSKSVRERRSICPDPEHGDSSMGDGKAEPPGPDLTQGIVSSDLLDQGKLLGHVGEEPVLLARQGAEVFAIGAVCTH